MTEIAELKETYIRHLKAKERPEESIKGISRRIGKLEGFLQAEESKSLLELENRSTQAFLNWLQEGERNYAAGYINLIISDLGSFYDWLQTGGHVLSNPFRNIGHPRNEKRLPRDVPTDKEMRRLIGVIPRECYLHRAVVELLYGSGLRREEVANLKLCDLDLENCLLKVLDVKNRRERMVPINDLTRYALQDYLAYQREELCGQSEGRNQYYDRKKAREAQRSCVFLSAGGLQISTALINRIVRRYCKKSGLNKRITAHSLRHACATEMLKGGAGIRWIQRMLGHQDIKTTLIYTKVGIEDLKRCVEKFHPHGSGGRS